MKKTKIIYSFLSLTVMLCLNSVVIAAMPSDEALDYRMRGYTLQQEGQLDQAMQYYKKAVQLDPSYASPHNDLGVIYEMLKFSEPFCIQQ